MELFLHSHKSKNELAERYKRAFEDAVELFIVSAYLTEWDSELKLNSKCHSLRIVVGKDFGITRKSACEAVMKWLPARRKAQFLVADDIRGFHPKAMFWKEATGNVFAIIGSSNLTRAAFAGNWEANIYSRISQSDYENAKAWMHSIGERSVVVSEDWLDQYVEAPLSPGGRSKTAKSKKEQFNPVITLPLPRPKDIEDRILDRRKQLRAFQVQKPGLVRLFRQCAKKEITSPEFYDELPTYWGYESGDRLQGHGFEILGKHSNFQTLSASFVKILEAKDGDRDDVVAAELDKLADRGVPTRKAFFSEILCLSFPKLYPVLNSPVARYLKEIKFRSPRSASEGARYVDIARKLRMSLVQNPDHPAKNLVELDVVIWSEHGKSA